MKTLPYEDWQKLRTEARNQEQEERRTNMEHARPPFQVSVSDQIVRHLLARVGELEGVLKAQRDARVPIKT